MRPALAMILHKFAKVFEANIVPKVSVHYVELSETTAVPLTVYLYNLEGTAHLFPPNAHRFRICWVTDRSTCDECLVFWVACIVFRRSVGSF